MKVFELPFVEEFLFFKEIDSTNTRAKSLTQWPSDGIVVLRAERQTSGRGQRGNSFFSFSDGGIWVTLVVKPPSIDQHFIHNRSMVLAITDQILKRVPSAPVSIKWPNDVYYGDRKICGLLLETAGPNLSCIVIGFGLNVNIPFEAFPPELHTIATSLLIETGQQTDANELLIDILTSYWQWTTRAISEAHAVYSSRLYGLNRQAAIGDFSGTYMHVEQDGSICLMNGSDRRHFSGGPLRFV